MVKTLKKNNPVFLRVNVSVSVTCQSQCSISFVSLCLRFDYIYWVIGAMLNSKNDILPGLKTADVYYVRAGLVGGAYIGIEELQEDSELVFS